MAAEAWNSFQNKTHFVTAEATWVRQEQELGDTFQTSKRNKKQKKTRKRFKTFKREIFKTQMKNSEEAFTRILSEINKYAAQFQLRLSQNHTIDRRFRFDRFLLLVDSRDDESNLISRRLCNSREGQGVPRWRSVSRSVVSHLKNKEHWNGRTSV